MKRNSKGISLREWDFKVSIAMKTHSSTSTKGYLNATISHRGKRIRFAVEGSSRLPISCWNKRSSSIVGQSKQANAVKASIENLSVLVEQAACDLIDELDRAKMRGPNQFQTVVDAYDSLASLERIRDAYHQRTALTRQEQSLTVLVDKFINEYPSTRAAKGEELKPGTLKNYRTMRNQIEQFELHSGRVKLQDLIRNSKSANVFAADWHNWLKNVTSHADPTIGRMNKELNTMFRWMEKDVLTDAHKLISLNAACAADQKDSDAVLTNREIDLIWALDLTEHPDLVDARALLVLVSEVGTRYSDIHSISTLPTTVATDHQIITQIKTGGPQLIVHTERVKEILTHFCNGWPDLVANLNYNTRFNKLIREVCKVAGITRMVRHLGKMESLCEVISSHSLRKSSITNDLLAGVSDEIVRQTSGHADARSLRAYDKRSPSQIANAVIRARSQQVDNL